MRRRILLAAALVLFGATGEARIMDDDGVDFGLPMGEGCQICDGEWEPLFPPLVDSPTPPEDLLFTGLSVGEVSEGESEVPEPTTWLLIGSGLTGFALWRRRQNRAL